MTTTALAPDVANKVITYTPLGEKQPIELKIETTRRFLCVPTKSGIHPEVADVVKFMMLCQARELNPWTGDAFLVGYDSKDGPTFSLITAVQALHKRADMSPQYDGLEAGIIVRVGKAIQYREGAMGPLDGERLIGGWCNVYRKDRTRPFRSAIKLEAFRGRGRWNDDPAGMIRKCAVAAALREALPSQLGGMYTYEEMNHLERGGAESSTRIEQLVAALKREKAPPQAPRITPPATASTAPATLPETATTGADNDKPLVPSFERVCELIERGSEEDVFTLLQQYATEGADIFSATERADLQRLGSHRIDALHGASGQEKPEQEKAEESAEQEEELAALEDYDARLRRCKSPQGCRTLLEELRKDKRLSLEQSRMVAEEIEKQSATLEKGGLF